LYVRCYSYLADHLETVERFKAIAIDDINILGPPLIIKQRFVRYGIDSLPLFHRYKYLIL